MTDEQSRDAGLEPAAGDYGDELPEEALDELAAVAEAESVAADAEQAAQAEELAAVARDLAAQREQTHAALTRYREAVLAAEPDLPPELVNGETLEELDQSLAAARRAVAQIRERLSAEAEGVARGFPVGAPARTGVTTQGMSAAEKIAVGLEEQARRL